MADEVDNLPELFWAVARRLRGASVETLAPWGLAPSHARALAVLMRAGSMRPSELSERLHVTPRSATDVIDTLEERGLVRRDRDPDDRRATLVTMTDEGKDVGHAIWQVRSADSQRLFGALSAADRAKLRSILTKLAPPAD